MTGFAMVKMRSVFRVGCSFLAGWLSLSDAVWAGWEGARMAEDYFPELASLLRQAEHTAPAAEAGQWILEEARGNSISAAAAGMPYISASGRVGGSYEYRQDLDGSNVRAFGNANLTMRQPIYHWGAVRASMAIGDIRFSEAQARADRDLRFLNHDIRSQYLRLVLARQALQALRRSQAMAVDLLSTQEDMVARGALAEHSLLETRLVVQEYEEQIDAAAGVVIHLESTLALLTGWAGVPQDLGHGSIPEVEPVAEDTLRLWRSRCEQGDLSSFAIDSARRSLAVEEEYHTIVQAENKPKVNLVAGVFQDQLESYGSSSSSVRVYGFAGVQVDWNLFDGHNSKGKRISSLARQRLAELQVRRGQAELRQQVMAILDNLELSRKQMESRALRLELMEAKLRHSEEQATRGQIADRRLLEERLEVEHHRRVALQARVDYLTQLSLLEATLGAGISPVPSSIGGGPSTDS